METEVGAPQIPRSSPIPHRSVPDAPGAGRFLYALGGSVITDHDVPQHAGHRVRERLPPAHTSVADHHRGRPSTGHAGAMPREPRTYSGHDRPLVEVLVDGRWCPGELRAWLPDPDGDGWRANVGYSTGPGENYISTVPAERVRPVEDT